MRLFTAIAVSLVFVTGCGTLPNVQFVPGDDKIDVMMGGNHFTSYRYGDQLTKPILFPLRSPSEILVNRGYPLAEVEGESKDHPHFNRYALDRQKRQGSVRRKKRYDIPGR